MATKKKKVVKSTTASGTALTSKLDECVAHVEQASALIESGSTPLTVTQKKHTLKLRKGGGKYIPDIAALAKASGLELASHPVDAMLANMETAQSYASLHQRTTVLLKTIEDNVMRAQSEAWQTATLTYSMLRPLAKRDGNVAETLAPIKAFLATGKRSKTKEPVVTAPHGTGATVSGTAVPAAAVVTPAAAVVTQAAPSAS